MRLQEDLSIKAMTINQIYTLFLNNKLVVNRKYQRKLCWTIEEKRNFIDTIENGLPVPMFLFASTSNNQYEIIDGMQRLDAICSFISQKYELKNGYFNLESMPDTLEQLKNKTLKQRKPCIDMKICKDISNYPLSVSVFTVTEEGEVEEIFKRINSTGKHLALQELRQVGVDSKFARIVRVLSTEMRGDVSEDVLLLKDMSQISLSNYRLPYSIFVDDIFWVKNGIVNKSEIRQSRDEEAVAYLVANMLLGKSWSMSLSAQKLNKLYGYSSNPLDEKIPFEMTQIESAIDGLGMETVLKNFRVTISCIEEMLALSRNTFRGMVRIPQSISDLIIPFGLVFLAIYRLIVIEKRSKVDYSCLSQKFNENCTSLLAKTASKNSVQDKENTLDKIYRNLLPAFSITSSEDPMRDNWTQSFINLLNKSRTEQVLYDFKIGFVPLNGNKIDTDVIDQVVKTLTAINNVAPRKVGYVIVGVANNVETANKYKDVYQLDYEMINGLPLCGIEHDAIAISDNLDRYTHTIKEHIRHNKYISEEYKLHILTEIVVPMIYGKHVILFKTNFSKPVTFDNDYYIREFTDVHKVDKDKIPIVFENYYHFNGVT